MALADGHLTMLGHALPNLSTAHFDDLENGLHVSLCSVREVVLGSLSHPPSTKAPTNFGRPLSGERGS